MKGDTIPGATGPKGGANQRPMRHIRIIAGILDDSGPEPGFARRLGHGCLGDLKIGVFVAHVPVVQPKRSVVSSVFFRVAGRVMDQAPVGLR